MLQPLRSSPIRHCEQTWAWLAAWLAAFVASSTASDALERLSQRLRPAKQKVEELASICVLPAESDSNKARLSRENEPRRNSPCRDGGEARLQTHWMQQWHRLTEVEQIWTFASLSSRSPESN